MKDYEKLLEKAKLAYRSCASNAEKRRLESIFPELKVAEDEDNGIRKDLIEFVKQYGDNFYGQISKASAISWLERQGEKIIFPTFTFDDILALQCCMKAMSKDEELYKQLQSFHNRLHDAYCLEKQGEKKSKDKYTFNAIPRLLDMIEPTDRAKRYCQKLIDSLQQEGYVTDAKIISEHLKLMNGEEVSMATMDGTDEKQAESSKPGTGNQPHEGNPDNPYDMSFEDAQQYASGRGIDIPINDGDVFADERHITQTIGNILRWADEHPKGEPKFRVGDWIIGDDSSINKDYDICRITNVENGIYTVESIYGHKGCNTFEMFEKNYRLWSIVYAKNGDILSYVTDKGDLWIMSYYSLYEPYRGHVHYNALLANDELSGKGTCFICIDNLKPATKEQREQLEKALEGAISDN